MVTIISHTLGGSTGNWSQGFFYQVSEAWTQPLSMKHSVVMALWLACFGVQWNGLVSHGQYHNTLTTLIHAHILIRCVLCDYRQKEHQTEFRLTFTLYTDKSSPNITYNVVYLVLGSVHWNFPWNQLLCCSELDQPESRIQLAEKQLVCNYFQACYNTWTKLWDQSYACKQFISFSLRILYHLLYIWACMKLLFLNQHFTLSSAVYCEIWYF